MENLKKEKMIDEQHWLVSEEMPISGAIGVNACVRHYPFDSN